MKEIPGDRMSLFSPVTEILRGVRAYPWGLRWLMGHKRYFALLMLPTLVGLALLIAAWNWLLPYRETLVAMMLPSMGDAWWQMTLFYAAEALVSLSLLILSLIGCLLVMNITAAPLYEIVSMAVERDLTGTVVEEPGLGAAVRIMVAEAKKAAFILGISALLLFIPIVNAVALFITAFLIGWNFIDYPLARRGWTFRQRLGFVVGQFWTVTAYGLWFMIPFVQAVLMPFAVVGGTRLCLESMQGGARTPTFKGEF